MISRAATIRATMDPLNATITSLVEEKGSMVIWSGVTRKLEESDSISNFIVTGESDSLARFRVDTLAGESTYWHQVMVAFLVGVGLEGKAAFSIFARGERIQLLLFVFDIASILLGVGVAATTSTHTGGGGGDGGNGGSDDGDSAGGLVSTIMPGILFLTGIGDGVSTGFLWGLGFAAGVRATNGVSWGWGSLCGLGLAAEFSNGVSNGDDSGLVQTPPGTRFLGVIAMLLSGIRLGGEEWGLFFGLSSKLTIRPARRLRPGSSKTGDADDVGLDLVVFIVNSFFIFRIDLGDFNSFSSRHRSGIELGGGNFGSIVPGSGEQRRTGAAVGVGVGVVVLVGNLFFHCIVLSLIRFTLGVEYNAKGEKEAGLLRLSLLLSAIDMVSFQETRTDVVLVGEVSMGVIFFLLLFLLVEAGKCGVVDVDALTFGVVSVCQ